jgi:hypothetical protein
MDLRSSLKILAVPLAAAIMTGCAARMGVEQGNMPSAGAAAGLPVRELLPEPFPAAGRDSLRPLLTDGVRKRLASLGQNGLKGLNGDTVSRAITLFTEDRARAGVITFEIEGGAYKGIHQCEALGRGLTSTVPAPGWISGVVREPGGRETNIFYAPKEAGDGATLPGIYDLRNIRPSEYKIKLIDDYISGESELLKRLSGPDGDKRPFYTGAWADWYPRDPRYAEMVPVDMVWSVRYQGLSQSAGVPVFERAGIKKDPEQIRKNPRYYSGPYGRYGTAIHTDRWDDPQTAADRKLSGRNEFRSFLFRDTEGCLKLRADCLSLVNVFIDEQSKKGRLVQLEIREIK